MTSDDYRINDLKGWNNLQLKMLEEFGSTRELDYVSSIAEWFVRLVDDLGRLPSWDEIRAFFPTEKVRGKLNS